MSGAWAGPLASLPRLFCAAIGDDAELRDEASDAAKARAATELNQVAAGHGLQPAMEVRRELARVFDRRDLVPLRADYEHPGGRDRELSVERARHDVNRLERAVLVPGLFFRRPEMAVEQRRVGDRRERNDGDGKCQPRLERRREGRGKAAEAHSPA